MAAVAAAAVVVVGGGILVLGIVGRGALRLGEAAYSAMDQAAADMVAREQQRHCALLKQLMQAQTTATINAPESVDLHAAEPAASIARQQFTEAMTVLEAEVAARKEDEEKRQLRHTISDGMQQKLDTLRQQWEAQQAPARRSVAARGNATSHDAASGLADLLAHCEALRYVYPEEMADLEAQASTFTAEAIGDTLHNLQLKKERLNADAAGLITKLADAYAKVRNSPLAPFLPPTALPELQRMYRRLRDKSIPLTQQDIEDFSSRGNALLHQAKSVEEQTRFADGVSRAVEAMHNVGYATVTTHEDADLMHLQGRMSDGKAISLRLKKTGSQNGNLQDIALRVAEVGYNDEDTWRQAGHALVRELASVGIEADWQESDSHFRGQLSQSAADILRHHLRTMQVDNVTVISTQETSITTNCGTFTWAAGTDPAQLVTMIQAQKLRTPAPSAGQREKIRES
ncbi:MAG: hypothetical protein BWK76_08160 [Desulfobulbaceae bacterium A2]|nr:MAG: hypothetical protein BWK76_08160 [Desulfobulbaceae bacterium A2]